MGWSRDDPCEFLFRLSSKKKNFDPLLGTQVKHISFLKHSVRGALRNRSANVIVKWYPHSYLWNQVFIYESQLFAPTHMYAPPLFPKHRLSNSRIIILSFAYSPMWFTELDFARFWTLPSATHPKPFWLFLLFADSSHLLFAFRALFRKPDSNEI